MVSVNAGLLSKIPKVCIWGFVFIMYLNSIGNPLTHKIHAL